MKFSFHLRKKELRTATIGPSCTANDHRGGGGGGTPYEKAVGTKKKTESRDASLMLLLSAAGRNTKQKKCQSYNQLRVFRITEYICRASFIAFRLSSHKP